MKTLRLPGLFFGFTLSLGPALAAESAPIAIDTLAALADYAGRDHVRVKMKPGVYLLNDVAMARAAEVKHPEVAGKSAGAYRVNTLLHFAGSDSVYDLAGVVIHLDTKLHQSVPGPLDKIFVSGRRTTISGLEFVDLGDTPPGNGGLRMLHVIGNGNRIENVTLRARGSAPYGYGNLLGKGGNALVPLHKQSCLLITGRDNHIVGTTVIARVFGHGIVMQGAVNTLIQGCYVEGELRLTDDMLKETAGPAHQVGFQSDYPPGKITPGRMVALSEDGIRAYPRGSQVGQRRTETVTVIDCTVRNMRSGFDLAAAGGKISVTGCTAIGSTEKGYSIPTAGEITRSAGDAMYAPLLSLHEKNGRDCQVELRLIGTTSAYGPQRLAEINGSNHRIVITPDPAGEPTQPLPLVFGASFWADVHHFRNPTASLESLTGARGIELHNLTTMPVVLGPTARDCVVTSRGEVRQNQGQNNQIRAVAERVVCFGDSITKRGYPEELGKLLGVEVINAGVGGNTTTAALKRLPKDVLDRRPTVVVIFFGTNDSRLDAPKVHVPIARYVANLREMIGRAEGISARAVLCTVPPINPEPYFTRHAREPFAAAGGLAQVLANYRAAVLRLGVELGLPVVDLAQDLTASPEWLSADGVHPSPAGNTIIARLVAEKVAPLLARRTSAAGSVQGTGPRGSP